MFLRCIAVISLHIYISNLTAAEFDNKATEITGKVVYEKHCLACHQANGAGVPYMQPALIDAPWVTGDPQALAVFVFSGGLYSAERKQGQNHNVMPAFTQLDDASMAAVLTYIRENFSNNAAPVELTHVAAAREIMQAMEKSRE